MKRLLLIIWAIFLISNQTFAIENTTLNLQVYSTNKMFGLEDTHNNKITEAKFKKLIRVGSSIWLVQDKQRFGLINNQGEYVVYPRYRHAERYLGKFVKLGNDHDFGLYDGNGNMIIPPIYSSIDLLYGKMFLTCKNFKYGVVDFTGKTLLKNEFDDIYMPDQNSMRVQYEGEWFEFSQIPTDTEIEGTRRITINDKDITFVKLVSDTSVRSGYYAVSFTDYIIKVISTISPAYEKTIDDMMLSHGADTVERILNPIWLVQFPYVYVKKYITDWKAPNNGPLSPVKQNLRRKIHY